MDPLGDPLTTCPMQRRWKYTFEPYPSWRFRFNDDPDRQFSHSSVWTWNRTRSAGPELLLTLRGCNSANRNISSPAIPRIHSIVWIRFLWLLSLRSMQWIISLPPFFPPCLSHHCSDMWSAGTGCAESKLWGNGFYSTQVWSNAIITNPHKSHGFSPGYPPFLQQSLLSHWPLVCYHPTIQLSN